MKGDRTNKNDVSPKLLNFKSKIKKEGNCEESKQRERIRLNFPGIRYRPLHAKSVTLLYLAKVFTPAGLEGKIKYEKYFTLYCKSKKLRENIFEVNVKTENPVILYSGVYRQRKTSVELFFNLFAISLPVLLFSLKCKSLNVKLILEINVKMFSHRRIFYFWILFYLRKKYEKIFLITSNFPAENYEKKLRKISRNF